MKVGGISNGKAVDSARRRKEAGRGAEFAEHLKEAMAATEPGAAVETAPPASIEQLLAIQEAPATVSREGRKSARQYGHFLLDRLEDIRLALLAGAIPKDQLARLAQTVRQRRERSDDPRLNEILDEIELRVEVEIAKLTRPVGS
ncbi:MAG: flagellar assembly protein FliX [Alphaproteobacteria bacterium]|nr:flagellar assembly protein FliX [Alphaproteobacteria bacterium]